MLYHGALFSQSQIGSDLDGEAASDQSGWSVSMSSDGSRVVIGAYLNDGNGSNSGHARIYALSGGTWSQLGSDINGELSSDLSGRSVAISEDGSRVAVGAIFNDENGSSSGHVRVYRWTGASWVQVGNDIDGEAANDQSGINVSLSNDGSRVAIGSHLNDENGAEAGLARVYELSGVSWIQMGSDIDGEAVNDRLGYSLSLSSDGSRFAVGAYLNNGGGSNSGHTQIFEWSGSSWDLMGSDIHGEAANDWAGYSVSLSSDGTIVAIGAPANDGNGSSSGHVRIYQWNGSSWIQLGADIDGEAGSDQSGYSVSLASDGATVAIGAPSNDGTPSNGGHVRIYEWNGSAWLQLGADIDGETSGDESGFALSLAPDAESVAIGAHFNDGNGSNSGHVRVYNMEVALPVEVVSLSAKVDFDDVLVNWTTASELNNAGFWIQKSKDGDDWINVGFVQGKGTSNDLNDYMYWDQAPFTGMNYYRLNQIDFDGVFEYSKVIQISLLQNKQIKVYPNPAKNSFHLTGISGAEIEVLDQLGRIVKKAMMINSELDISALPKGVYFVRVASESQSPTWKFIKE